MPFVQVKCPNCGGMLAVDSAKDAAVCPFCDTTFVIEKAINNYHITNNINIGAGAVVNVTGSANSDFEILAGVLKKYVGESAEVVIPDSITSIGSEAFSGCTGLTSVTIPDSVTSIGYSAFEGCTGLTRMVIPESVTSIGESSFSGCTGLTSVTIGNSVMSIGGYAFSGCTKLTSVTIPASVTYIGDCAFTDLTSILVDDNNPNYSSDAYSVLYNKDKSVLLQYLAENTHISFTIPDSVMSIGVYAFCYCTSLTSVIIPDSVTSIGYRAFYDTAYYNNENSRENGVLYIGNHLIEAKKTLAGSYEISPKTKCIADSAFSGCTGLTSVKISNGVTSIGFYAFEGCTRLTSMTIPDSVASIGGRAFGNCTRLTSVTIPDSVTSIGRNAFYNCENLVSVVKPKHISASDFEGSKWYREKSKKGCYVATAVYGSYDCPEVWTLRRFRDNVLALTWYGRLFIALYYAISPTLVKWFGHTSWFNKMWRGRLDRMVSALQAKGYDGTPYQDRVEK